MQGVPVDVRSEYVCICNMSACVETYMYVCVCVYIYIHMAALMQGVPVDV
jgi:hypothetical protein